MFRRQSIKSFLKKIKNPLKKADSIFPKTSRSNPASPVQSPRSSRTFDPISPVGQGSQSTQSIFLDHKSIDEWLVFGRQDQESIDTFLSVFKTSRRTVFVNIEQPMSDYYIDILKNNNIDLKTETNWPKVFLNGILVPVNTT